MEHVENTFAHWICNKISNCGGGGGWRRKRGEKGDKFIYLGDCFRVTPTTTLNELFDVPHTIIMVPLFVKQSTVSAVT